MAWTRDEADKWTVNLQEELWKDPEYKQLMKNVHEHWIVFGELHYDKEKLKEIYERTIRKIPKSS